MCLTPGPDHMALQWQIQDSGSWSLMEESVTLPQYKMSDPGFKLKINEKVTRKTEGCLL